MARGTPIVNLIEIDTNEVITAVVSTQTYDTDFMLLATKLGEVKKTPLREFESVRRAGLISMGLEDGDELVFARLAKETDDVVLVSRQGKAIRFSIADLRSASRMSGGVRGMRLAATRTRSWPWRSWSRKPAADHLGDRPRQAHDFDDYPKHSRGGQGVLTHNVTARTGRVVAARTVKPDMEIMLIIQSGIVMRTTVDSISPLGRIAQGVQVVKPGPGDRVAELAVIDLSKSQPDVPPTVIGAGGAVPPPGTQTPRRGGSRPSRGSGPGRRRR